MKGYIIRVTIAFAVVFAIQTVASAQACTFTTSGATMTLNGNCTTETSIIVPNGFTLDGAGYTITAQDPVASHFVGGVIQNGGATAKVTGVTINTNNLVNTCDGGANRLRGILFDGASGSITNNTIQNIRQGPTSGCQEGNGIEVRNFGASPTTNRVLIDQNTVTAYQKTGIVANGNVDATITDNTVTGDGPAWYIAQNGIQVGFGGTGMLKRNTVSGNSYTGSSAVSGGILVVGGAAYGGDLCIGVQIQHNTVTNNDVGIFISQYDAGYTPPDVATKIKVVNNTISYGAVTNGYVYQAGISLVGNGDKLIANRISGAGYDPATLPGSTFEIDPYATASKIHANK